MQLILARHGNTFDPGDRPVWVGARTDLPLVAKGRDQAIKLGQALKAADLVPRRVLAGPLRRTRETASLALAASGATVDTIDIDDRLREIDYGLWEGKSSDEIRLMGGGVDLEAWEREGRWPLDAGWPSSSEQYTRKFLGLVDSVRCHGDDPTLMV